MPEMIQNHVLTLMIFFPLVGSAMLLLLPTWTRNFIRTIAIVCTAVPLVLAVWMYCDFSEFATGPAHDAARFMDAGADGESGTFRYVERAPWIRAFHVEYFVGVDGLSVMMVLLTALLSFLCVFASWNITKGERGYFALFLLLETGMMGVFCALDFFLFYVFWEVMLLPMYFLIGIWGGPRKEYAAIKFFLYTLAGSVLMLLVMIAFYWGTNVDDTHRADFWGVELAEGERYVHHSFDLTRMGDRNVQEEDGLLRTNPYREWTVPFLKDDAGNPVTFDVSFRMLLFLALFIGFAIKVPVFPFHTWLPDAHVEAPTAISVILAGVLLKMGAYGLVRVSYALLPDAARAFGPFLVALGVVNILYGAWCALAQSDLKKLVAYSSVSHMGFVLIGLGSMTTVGITGAMVQMFNHGTITAMLFLLVGVIYERAHHRDIDGFGGLGAKVPVFTGFTAFAFFASMGLPGLSGFIGEAMCFIGTWLGGYKLMVAIAALGIVFTAAYLLWAMQRVFLGPLNEKYKDLKEINAREIFTLAPLAAIVLFVGVYPMPLIDLIEYTMVDIQEFVSGGFHILWGG